MPSSVHRLRSRRHPRGVLLAAAAAAAGLTLSDLAGAQDQVPWPIDPSVGQYGRAVRRLEQRATMDPGGAAREATRLRRDLIAEQGGLALTPDQARIERELSRIESLAPPGEAVGPPVPGPEPETRLPSSYADESDGLPSITRELRLVGRLLDRATDGIAQRNAEQAGSDLATAEASLLGLRGALPAAEMQPLAARLAGLRRELAALAPDEGDGREPPPPPPIERVLPEPTLPGGQGS